MSTGCYFQGAMERVYEDMGKRVYYGGSGLEA
jgi:hypothetical protein